jgi:hypothetical protein
MAQLNQKQGVTKALILLNGVTRLADIPRCANRDLPFFALPRSIISPIVPLIPPEKRLAIASP